MNILHEFIQFCIFIISHLPKYKKAMGWAAQSQIAQNRHPYSILAIAEMKFKGAIFIQRLDIENLKKKRSFWSKIDGTTNYLINMNNY